MLHTLHFVHSEKIWYGNSADKLRHVRSVAYSVELVLPNKRLISGGGASLPVASIPMGQGGHVPPIFTLSGTSVSMSPNV